MPSAEEILKQYWGYDRFRPLQKDIIDYVVSGTDTLALLPTGGGKSLCYQVPALMMEGMCLVISPLIALMQDQVQQLAQLEIPATCIHSGMHYLEVKQILSNAMNDAYKLLYVSPERLQTDLFKQFLPAFNLNLLAIDEAHCISQWGHDFRPDYTRIVTVREEFPQVPVLALTATATEHVQNDIALQLQMRSPVLVVQSFERKNIQYAVNYTENKNQELLQQLGANNTCTIIYCRSRRQTEVLSKLLSQYGISSAVYHAGMPKRDRDEAQRQWMMDEVQVMIATTAFGMGINKPDVRLVINYDAPEHLEAYYQEAGRAGRNNMPALSVVYYNQGDINRLENSIEIQYPEEPYLRHIYQCVAEYLQIPISAEPYTYYNFDLKEFCQRFKLDTAPASYALKLLEQEGLWTMSESVFMPPTLYCPLNREELDFFMNGYPQYTYLITSILRLYGSLFQYPTPVRLSTIAKQAKMNRADLELALKQLDYLGTFEYRAQTEGPQIFFHHYRVDSRQLIINYKRIQALKQRHAERTAVMIAYLYNMDVCRTKMLLSYFNEQKADDCGHCDVCRQKIRTAMPTPESILSVIRRSGKLSLLSLAEHFPDHPKEYISAIVRRMADERTILLDIYGNISIA